MNAQRRIENRWVRVCFAVSIGCFLTLIGLIIRYSGSQTPGGDEKWYLATVGLLHRRGFTTAFLRELPGPAGPLFTFVHALFEPLTHLHLLGTRLLTAALAACTVLCLAATMRLRRDTFAGMRAWQLLATPVFLTISGMAFTEMPAMALFSAQFAVLLLSARMASSRLAAAVGLATLAGVLCGLAILGRQQFLLALLILPVLSFQHPRAWLVLSVYVSVALVLPLWVFAVWGGLVPPDTAYVQRGVALQNGIMATSYAAIAFCIYDLSWIRGRGALIAAVVIATCAVGNLFIDLKPTGDLWTPARLAAEAFLPPSLMPAYSKFARGLLVGFSLAFVAFLVATAARRRRDLELMTMILVILAIPLASIRVTHTFSPRYSAMVLPFVLLVACERSPDSFWRAMRLTAAGSLGLYSMYKGYLH
jgi:hypothetical protein